VNDQDTDARSSEPRAAPGVPDFELLRPIGRGGFGEVWLATNRTTGRLCAVKVIPLRFSGQGDPAAREINSLTRLEANSRCRHPNLLQIDHVGKTATHLFYVMDAADDISGEPASTKPDYRPATLQTVLQEGKGDWSNSRAAPGTDRRLVGPFRQIGPVPFSPEVCLDYARQLLAGLAMLHGAGMVHRDVKPANCLFVGGQLKLADFGLLTAAHPLISRVGTQKYMPPDGRMDMRADVYAAGLVIYEMLSGLPVEEFPRLGGQSRRIGDSPILASLLRLVLRACERESEKRPADARAMLAEMTVPPRSNPQRRRQGLFVAIGAAAALVIVSGSVWVYRERAGANFGQTTKNIAPPSHKPAATIAPQLVDVSFVTDPLEANIYLDGELLRTPDGEPYTTPCTVNGLPARTCRVAFRVNDEPQWEADGGPYDLSRIHQIVSKRP
jgi:eukaryotic-like serine/threonine-protein kinase